MPLWFSLAVNGTDAYRDAVETVLAMARDAADLIERSPHVELVRPPGLSIVLLRRPGWRTADYAGWSDHLLDRPDRIRHPDDWEGETVARMAFLHPDTTLEMVEEILATMA